MSDTEDTQPNGKKRGTDRERAQVDHLISDEELFTWIERLFYDEPEPAHFPERIDVHVLTAKGRYGDCLKVLPFAPKKAPSRKAQEETGVEYQGSAKPTKARIVELTNMIVGQMKNDCNQSGKKQTYVIAAHHTAMNAGPYDRTTRTYFPVKSKDAHLEGEDEEQPLEKQWTRAMHEEQREMINIVGRIWEGATDRDHRTIKTLMERITHLEKTLEVRNDQLEKALSQELDRAERRQWMSIKGRAADRGLTLLEGVVPMLLPKLLGNGLAGQGGTRPEVLTLRNFFKEEADGGNLTREQAFKAFGDDQRRGVLTKEQASVLYQVAHGQREFDDIFSVMPGGTLEITVDQTLELQQIFGLDQLGPLFLVFQSLQQQAQQRQQQPQGSAKTS